MPSRRKERIASLLKQAVSRIIMSELNDPRMGFVTVVKVEPSPDLKSAKVHVSVMGEASDINRTLEGLKHAARFIRRQVGEEVALRIVPELVFVEDKSVKGSVRVSRLIAEALAESRPPEESGPADEEDGDADDEGKSDEASDDAQENEPEEGQDKMPGEST